MGAEPTRTFDRLIELWLVQRVVPVTEHLGRTRRRSYRIAGNYLAFWLGVVDRYRAEIERGLSGAAVLAMEAALDDAMGWPWEEAFRWHLRRMIEAGELSDDIVAVGPWWTADSSVELDAVGLAGRRGEAVLIGEAKWAKRIDGRALVADLERRGSRLPLRAEAVTYAICTRSDVGGVPVGAIAVAAADIFGG